MKTRKAAAAQRATNPGDAGASTMDAVFPALDAEVATSTNYASAPEAGAIEYVEAPAMVDALILPLGADTAIPANAASAHDAEIVDVDNAHKDQVQNIRGTTKRGRGGRGGRGQGRGRGRGRGRGAFSATTDTGTPSEPATAGVQTAAQVPLPRPATCSGNY